MRLWDNDLRNAYKKPELHAYYWCVDFCWKAVEKTVDKVKDAVDTAGAAVGAAAGKVTKPIAQGIENAGNAIGDAMQTVGDATGVSGLVNTIGEKTGLKELGQNIHAGFQYGAGLVPEQQSSANSGTVDDGEDKGAQTKAQTDEAATAAADAGGAAEREAANSAREAGTNASRSGMMAGVNNQAAGLLNGLYQTGAAQNASTQADYRNKMAQADIMDTKAGNMAKGAQIMPWASALQGAGQGAQLGMMLSDENTKEADGIDDDKLAEAISQFKSLYSQLQELKGENK